MNTKSNIYLNIETFYHKLNPAIKLLSLILIITNSLLISDLVFYLVIIIVIYLSCLIGNFPLQILTRNVFRLRYILFVIIFFNLFLFKQGDVLFEYLFIKIYLQSLYFSIVFCLRLILLVIINTIFIASTKIIDLTQSLNRIFNIFGKHGYNISMILSLTLTFIPKLNIDILKIIDAQKSRGMLVNKGNLKTRINSVIAIIIPAMILAFNNADNLALAMQLRGFSPSECRSSLYKVEYKSIDYIFIFILSLYMVFSFFFFKRLI